MEYGEVILEHRPIVICQCEHDLCLVCNIHKYEHTVQCKTCGHYKDVHQENKCAWNEFFIGNEPDACMCKEYIPSHDFYQRNNIFGPRVVIDNKTFRGVCFKCKKEYQVVVQEVISASIN